MSVTDIDVLSGRLIAMIFGGLFLWLAAGFLKDDYKLVGCMVWALGLGFVAAAFLG